MGMEQWISVWLDKIIKEKRYNQVFGRDDEQEILTRSHTHGKVRITVPYWMHIDSVEVMGLYGDIDIVDHIDLRGIVKKLPDCRFIHISHIAKITVNESCCIHTSHINKKSAGMSLGISLDMRDSVNGDPIFVLADIFKDRGATALMRYKGVDYILGDKFLSEHGETKRTTGLVQYALWRDFGELSTNIAIFVVKPRAEVLPVLKEIGIDCRKTDWLAVRIATGETRLRVLRGGKIEDRSVLYE